jgi:hypothetical protein
MRDLVVVPYSPSSLQEEAASPKPRSRLIPTSQSSADSSPGITASSGWWYHADMLCPEDHTLSDSDWPTLRIREEWKTGHARASRQHRNRGEDQRPRDSEDPA